MLTRALTLAFCAVVAARSLAKPPDLPQPVAPDLSPVDVTAEQPAGAPDESSPCKCVTACPFVECCRCLAVWLCSGPFCSQIWATPEPETPDVAPHVFGSYDLSDLIGEEKEGNTRVA